jgi:low affinity Fe/Cu permease
MLLIRRIALRTPEVVGSTRSFFVAIVLVAAWIVAGIPAHFDTAWLLWPSAIASVVTFLIVFSLQYTQNRDTRAIQLKLDELLRGSQHTRTQLVKLERLSDEELAQVEKELLELRDREQEND